MPTSARSGRQRPPTLRDVAELAGVSIKTVSNVVNDYQYVRDATRRHVRAAIAEVGYRPQAAAQHLRTGESGLITLAVPSLIFSYFSDIAQVFIDEAQGRGRTVLLHSTSAGREAERIVLNGFDRVLGDGVIFSPYRIEESYVAAMERMAQPTVFIGESLPEQLPAGSDYVRIDNVRSTSDATSHLLERGRRRIAFLGALPAQEARQPHGSAVLRLRGFRQALEDHGCSPDDALVQVVGDWHQPDGAAGIRELLQREPRLDGVVCANDDLAFGALAGLWESGRRVPEDIALIGYDDILEARFTVPPLSSIAPDKETLARTALDLLADRVRGHDGPPRVVTVPHFVVARESSGRVPPAGRPSGRT